MNFGENVEKVLGTENQMVNLDLVGGTLLDCTLYA